MFLLIVGMICTFQNACAQNASPLTSVPTIEITRTDWGFVEDVAFSPDSLRLAVATGTGIWMFDTTLQSDRHFAEQTGNIYSIDWNWDGSLLASGSEDGRIQIWDMVETSPSYLTPIKTLQDSGSIYFVAWSPDSASHQLVTRTVTEHFYSSASDQVAADIHIWNAASGEIERTVDNLFDGSREVVWSSDGKLLACAGGTKEDGIRLFVWDALTGARLARSARSMDKLESLAWRPNSMEIAVSDLSLGAVLYGANEGQALNSLLYNAYPWWSVHTLAWNSDGSQIIAGDRDGRLIVVDADTDQSLLRLENEEDVYRLDWSETGDRIAAVIRDNRVRVFDMSGLPHIYGIPTVTPWPTLPLTNFS